MSHKMKCDTSVSGSFLRKMGEYMFLGKQRDVLKTYPNRKLFLTTHLGNLGRFWRHTCPIDSVAVMLLTHILVLHHKMAVSY